MKATLASSSRWRAASLVAIGFSLIAVGVDLTAVGTGVVAAVALAFGGFLYRINRKIGREKYEPRVRELSQLLADLDSA